MVAPEPWALTFSIQNVVSWEHDAAAHYVTFETARSKSVSNPTAMEDLTIVCQRGGARKNISILQLLVTSSLNNAFMCVILWAEFTTLNSWLKRSTQNAVKHRFHKYLRWTMAVTNFKNMASNYLLYYIFSLIPSIDIIN